MTNNIPKPEISPNFTLEDIRKIREWKYEQRKNMSSSEWLADEAVGAKKMLEEIASMRQQST
ncbi:MAG: hypothetical protein FWC97_06855 [Treponema sp.]|nr:hypothetical protein [Treponema sp.]